MGASDFGTIIQIGDILVSEDVVLDFFECDYESCRGKCCIAGDSGAPLGDDEPGQIERNYSKFSGLMTESGLNAVEDTGFFMIDRDGDMVTPLSAHSEACAYCHFGPSGECLCAIEKAGCTKPRSCSLYPVRVTALTGGGTALNVHHWDICKCAFEKGERDGVRVYQFLRKPLTDVYGEDFWQALDAAAGHLIR